PDRGGLQLEHQTLFLYFGSPAGAKSDWSLAESCDCISDLQISALCRRYSSRGDVRQPHHLLITQVIRNLGEICLRIRHQKILGLRTVDGVPKFPAAHRPATLRPIAPQAVVALAARRNGSHQHAFANRVSAYSHTELVNGPYRLMANDQSRLHRVFPFEDVQVRSADRGQRDANERFTWS